MSHNFTLLTQRNIPEIASRARLFRHEKSGAQLLSIENTDENKVFSINFPTPPADSTGVAHIMEHAVLCGSRKYPVKEPFVELVKGSLNTFVNAMTFADKTCYPVASQNLQDFYNLIDVYVDAVFHPIISPETLDQEGWHYELDDLDAPLVYKGVVFNEMKGAYSSPDSLLGRYAQQSLFPDNPYGVDSGGDPLEIPNLTYAQFKAFHETYYHPSNALIYFYGDDDPDRRLAYLDEILNEFDARPVDSTIPLQPAFSEPRRLVFPYDAGDGEDGGKGMLVVNWLLPDPLDTGRTLSLAILAYILIGAPASPLRKALIDSGLGEDLAGAGFENDLRQMYFSTGLKGLPLSSVTNPESPITHRPSPVETLLFSELHKLADEGIDPATVAAAVNTIEFRLRENNTGSFPRGLLLMLRSLTAWLYAGDPLAALAFEAPLQAIKDRLAAGEPFFENLIRQHLLENIHRTTVILKPESGLDERAEQAEVEKLAALRAALSPAELQAILEKTHQLKLRQETPDPPEALATIPSLKLEDLERHNKLIPLEATTQPDGSRLLYHDLSTNGIAYLDLGFDLHVIPQDDLPYAALFGSALLEMGTETEDFVRISQRIGQKTGGIHPTYLVASLPGQSQAATWLFLRGKATLDHTADLLAILRDLLLTVRLDNPERLRQMVLESKADLEAALTPAGHRLVNTRLRSHFSEAGWVDEQMGGVSHLYFLRRLAAEIESDWPAVLARLQRIHRLIIDRTRLVANVTLDAAGWQVFQPQIAAFIASLPTNSVILNAAKDLPPAYQSWRFKTIPSDQGLAIPAQVNFVGKGFNLYDLGYQLHGSYAVINNYLHTTWLWEKVRVEGGAYGGFCQFDQRSGVYTYLSYRDPNIAETLAIYDQAGAFLSNLDQTRLTPAELTKSIIGAIGDLDAYQLPDAKGYTSLVRWLVGESDETRQQRREQILSTTLADFHAFGDLLERARSAARIVVMGAEESIQEAISQGCPLELEKVL